MKSIEEALMVVRQVMDRGVARGGIFNNIEEVNKAYESLKLITLHIEATNKQANGT